MKILLSLILMAASFMAYATMEAAWQNDPTSEIMGTKISSCPAFIYVENKDGTYTEKVWTNEIKKQKDSPVDVGRCVYR